MDLILALNGNIKGNNILIVDLELEAASADIGFISGDGQTAFDDARLAIALNSNAVRRTSRVDGLNITVGEVLIHLLDCINHEILNLGIAVALIIAVGDFAEVIVKRGNDNGVRNSGIRL